MDHLFIYFFSVFSFCVIMYFRIKILVFLFLECLMLVLINMWFKIFSASSVSFFCVVIFSTFMVLDSVLGLSIFIGGTRYSTEYSMSVISF